MNMRRSGAENAAHAGKLNGIRFTVKTIRFLRLLHFSFKGIVYINEHTAAKTVFPGSFKEEP